MNKKCVYNIKVYGPDYHPIKDQPDTVCNMDTFIYDDKNK